jgi:bla regulator protein blaR1
MKNGRRLRGCSVIAALIGLGLAAAPAEKMSFEVASIKRSKPELQTGIKVEHGRFTGNATLFAYIEFAYDQMPSPEQMDSTLARVPKWVATDAFEIDAMAQGSPTQAQMRSMVQSLLADRFKLQVHFVTTELPVLALLLEKPGKMGPKLRLHSDGPSCDVHLDVFPPLCEQFTAIPKPNHAIMVGYRNATIDRIASLLTAVGRLGGPVVDQTGLSGQFDFTLQFTPEPKGAPQPQDVVADGFQVTLQEALHEQLGLKLKPTKAPLESLVIDHAEPPAAN